MQKKEYSFHDREISWLSFNERVLQEAEDITVPLFERFRFLGIFSNNLDEFFRVRVPTVQRMIRYGEKAIPLLGFDPKITLQQIYQKNKSLQKRFEKTYENLKKELEKEHIYFRNETQIDPKHLPELKKYFDQTVHPALVPIMLSEDRPLPELNGQAIYLAIKLYDKISKKVADFSYALLEIPSSVVSRFYLIADEMGIKNIILLEDIIRCNLKEIFHIFPYDKIDAFTIKITRDSELDIEDDVSTGLMGKLATSLKKRRIGDPVRLVYDEEIPKDLLDFLTLKLGMETDDVLVAGGRYHNFKDYIDFPKIGASHLRYRSMPAIDHPLLYDQKIMFSAIKHHDILLSYPYQSYRHIIGLLREAAIDPLVSSIKITIYRLVSRNSKVIHSLINAARNGKKVMVVVELKARFDEESNMNYAGKLQDEGIRVIFGAPGLKVHAKLLLIRRKEKRKFVQYAHIGTGNFHEGTAKFYCDHSLLTSNVTIVEEVNKIFKFFDDNYKRFIFKELIVSPFNSRKQIVALIQQEIKNAKKGKEAYIILKLNSIQDRTMVEKLYEASQAGVKIQMIVRSINTSVNNILKQSENITAISIVDRMLEHGRILVFANGGEEKIYIGSTDWMKRSLDGRVEVMVPIYDENVRKILKKVLKYQLKDNVKARLWDVDLKNEYKKQEEGKARFRSQYELYAYFKKKLKSQIESRLLSEQENSKKE